MFLRRLRVLCLCLCLPLLLHSCAFKRAIFNNLDWLVVYQLDSYLDLSSAQEKSIKLPVHETVTWFKAERLGAVIELFQDGLKAVEARKIDAKTYASWLQRINVWQVEITGRITAPLALLLKQLNPEQTEHLRQKLSKSDKSLVKLLAASEQDFPDELADYADDAADKYKFWFGKLRKDQKALLVQKLAWNRTTLQEHLHQRQRFREYWLQLLGKRELKSLVTAIRGSAEADGSWRDPAYLRYRNETRERMQGFLIALFASLDETQWEHLEEVIRDIIGDLQALALSEKNPN